MDTHDPASNLWTHTAIPAPETPPLDGDARADVCVVGGGYTGLSTALHLAERGVDVLLIEAEAPGFGASGRNNGQVIPAYSRHNPDDVVKLFGPETGERLNAWTMASAAFVFDLIARHGIDCDAAQKGWVQPAHRSSRLAGIRRKHDQWAARGAPVEMVDRDETTRIIGSDIYHGAWMAREGGHIQPLSYARGLAHAAQRAGARLHASTPALAIERNGAQWRVSTPHGTVSADTVVLGTNAYTGSLWPGLGQTYIPFRTFHVATRPMSDNVARSVLPENHGFSDTRQALWAFRKDREHRIVSTAAPMLTPGARSSLRRSTIARLQAIFPQAAEAGVEHVWEGMVAITPDRLPRFHELAGGLYAGLGYSGRGIAMASAMGKLLADRATGTPASELPVPTAPVRPMPMHRLLVPLSRAMIGWYRWKDGRD